MTGRTVDETLPRSDEVKRDWVSIVYLLFALCVSMSVSQEYAGEPSLGRYLLFVAPVIVAALIRPLRLIKAASSKILVILFFVFISGGYFIVRGDVTATLQLLLLGLGTLWFCVKDVKFIDHDLYLIYVAMIGIGAVIWVATDLNLWGLIPGTTDATYGVWRVSFFPNIAFTAFFSLSIILIHTRDGLRDVLKSPIFLIALYFTIFSFVRTALICLVLYIFAFWVMRKLKNPLEMFFASLFIAVSATLFIAFSATIFDSLQNISIVSRLFLRNETQLSEFEIYQQLYRPWLWGEQLKLAWESPNVLGWGSIPFVDLVQNSIFNYGLESGDSVSFPTRLLSQFGAMGLLYWAFLLICLKDMAYRLDRWGCAVFPVIFMTMMQWGSMFHVTDPMALIYTGVLVKGADFIGTGMKSRQHRGDRPTISRRSVASASL